ncbi:MAG: hypothetical protein ACXVCY_10265 [Pseudobdellovibrionaceae bacterium]
MDAIGWIKIFIFSLLFCPIAWAGCLQSQNFASEGKKYFESEQYLLASIQFKLASQFQCSEEEKNQALYSYLLSMNRLGEKKEVLLTLEELEKKSSAEIAPKLNLFKKVVLDVPTDAKLSFEQRRRVDLWEKRDLHFAGEKMPWVAGTMSAIVPGAGQAYVGAWSSALYSFVLNSLFLATTLELQREGLYASSLASGLVFSVTYVGGILSANQAAHLFNKSRLEAQEKEKFLDLFPELIP